MTTWEKFTALGAIGPDLFYFLQDYNGATLGPLSDDIMLAFATYYFYDAASEDNWEPLLVILDQVNSTLRRPAAFPDQVVSKIWQDFINAWNATIGPVADRHRGDCRRLARWRSSASWACLGQQLMDGIKRACGGGAAHVRGESSGSLSSMRAGRRVPGSRCSCGATCSTTGSRPAGRKLLAEAKRQSQQAGGARTSYEQFLAFFLGYVSTSAPTPSRTRSSTSSAAARTAPTPSATIRSRTTSTRGSTRSRAWGGRSSPIRGARRTTTPTCPCRRCGSRCRWTQTIPRASSGRPGCPTIPTSARHCSTRTASCRTGWRNRSSTR